MRNDPSSTEVACSAVTGLLLRMSTRHLGKIAKKGVQGSQKEVFVNFLTLEERIYKEHLRTQINAIQQAARIIPWLVSIGATLRHNISDFVSC